MRPRPPTGYVLYDGPSQLDNEPIIAIINKTAGGSKNTKTGAMVQTWIFRKDLPPLEALRAGHDSSVCGLCPARGQWCYVQVGREVSSVWKAYQRGSYAPWPGADLVRGRPVRIGSYGDPAAVPLTVWEPILAAASLHTAYTHQWRLLGPEWQWCMASCDSPEEHEAAKRAGWRTFLTALPADPRPKGVASCPASKEQGFKLTCADCGHCGGTYNRGATRIGDVMIVAHGPLAARYEKWRQVERELKEAA